MDAARHKKYAGAIESSTPRLTANPRGSDEGGAYDFAVRQSKRSQEKRSEGTEAADGPRCFEPESLSGSVGKGWLREEDSNL